MSDGSYFTEETKAVVSMFAKHVENDIHNLFAIIIEAVAKQSDVDSALFKDTKENMTKLLSSIFAILNRHVMIVKTGKMIE